MSVETMLSLGNLLRCLHYYILSIPYVRLVDTTPFKHLNQSGYLQFFDSSVNDGWGEKISFSQCGWVSFDFLEFHWTPWVFWRSSEILEDSRRSLEVLKDPKRSSEIFWNTGRSWEILGDSSRFLEIIGNHFSGLDCLSSTFVLNTILVWLQETFFVGKSVGLYCLIVPTDKTLQIWGLNLMKK